MVLDQTAFENLSEKTINDLMQAMEDGLGDHLDADIQAGVLTIDLDDGGQYVINRHRPNRQIWMSSPFSGASHYDWDGEKGAWVSTRGGQILHQVLAAELAKAVGKPFSFD